MTIIGSAVITNLEGWRAWNSCSVVVHLYDHRSNNCKADRKLRSVSGFRHQDRSAHYCRRRTLMSYSVFRSSNQSPIVSLGLVKDARLYRHNNNNNTWILITREIQNIDRDLEISSKSDKVVHEHPTDSLLKRRDFDRSMYLPIVPIQ